MTSTMVSQPLAQTVDQAIQDDGLVSIIIPNYNHAQYLGDAIQSVLSQTYRNFEIIVIDDGSTDNTREVATQFGNQIRYIWQENQGLSAARNTGIRAASGDLIGLLDADDIYEPYFLSTLVAMLQANPDADGIYCGYRFVDDQNRPLAQVEARSIPPDQLYQALISGNFLVPESMLARRHCYEAVGPFDETLRACEDWDIWLKMARRFKIIGTILVECLKREQLHSFQPHNDSDRITTLVYVGSFYPWHGIPVSLPVFARALAQGAQARLLLIGSGDGLDGAKQLVNELNISNAVTFAGHLRPGVYAPMLAKAHIGVSPYCGWKEFSGLKILDYKAAGLPTIASGQDGHPPILTHEHTGLIVSPCDEDELFNAIARLCADSDLRRRMGQAARLGAEQVHGWDHTAARIEQIFTNVS